MPPPAPQSPSSPPSARKPSSLHSFSAFFKQRRPSFAIVSCTRTRFYPLPDASFLITRRNTPKFASSYRPFVRLDGASRWWLLSACFNFLPRPPSHYPRPALALSRDPFDAARAHGALLEPPTGSFPSFQLSRRPSPAPRSFFTPAISIVHRLNFFRAKSPSAYPTVLERLDAHVAQRNDGCFLPA